MRRPIIGSLAIIACLALAEGSVFAGQASQAAPTLKPEALAGTYKGTATGPNGNIQLNVTLKYENSAFSGAIEHSEGPTLTITGGNLNGDRLVLTFDMGGTTGTITANVKDGAHVEGSYTIGEMSGTVTLAKVPAEAVKPAPGTPAAGAAPDAKPAPASADDPITGQWEGITGNSDMSVPFTMRLKLEGDKVTGDVSSEQGGASLNTGTWKGGSLSMTFELSGMGTVTMVGAIQEGKLVGSLDVGGQMQMQWAAVRK